RTAVRPGRRGRAPKSRGARVAGRPWRRTAPLAALLSVGARPRSRRTRESPASPVGGLNLIAVRPERRGLAPKSKDTRISGKPCPRTDLIAVRPERRGLAPKSKDTRIPGKPCPSTSALRACAQGERERFFPLRYNARASGDPRMASPG